MKKKLGTTDIQDGAKVSLILDSAFKHGECEVILRHPASITLSQFLTRCIYSKRLNNTRRFIHKSDKLQINMQQI